MKKLLNDIIDYVRLLKYDYGLQASFDYSDIPAEHKEILLPHILHYNEYCTNVKKCNFFKCIFARSVVIRNNPQKPYFGKCYAGVEEYVFPVIADGKTVNFVSISGYKTANAKRPNFDRLANYNTTNSQALEKAYCTLNTDIPDLNDITCIVQPLVYMVQLYTMLLKRAKVINDSEKEYPAAYSAALDYIAENYKNNISISEIAAQCNFSVSRLSHIFKQYGNSSITQYMIKLKMIKAADLLLYTTAGISNIAAELGYNDPNYFSLQFKKYYGVSPKVYRKRKNDPST